MSKPRILIVENDPKWRENYCEIVNKLGYEAFVAEGVGDELISDALNKCKNNRCHVAVVDLHLRDDSDKYDDSGVDDVALQIGPTSVIIASGLIDVTKTNSIRDKAAEKKLEFHYFDKGGKGQRGEKAPQILSPMIQKLARSKSSIANGTSLRVSPRFFQLQLDQFLARMGFSYHIDKGQELIADLLVQLVRPDGEASELELVPLEDSVGSSSSAVSRNSFVARVKLKGSRRRDFVVKFAKPYAIAAEHRNYMDFVYRRIPWQSYAGLDEKPALFWEIGAIGLDLVGRALPFSTKYHLAEVTSDSSMKSILEAIRSAREKECVRMG